MTRGDQHREIAIVGTQAAVGVAASAVVFRTTLRIVGNLPFEPVAVPNPVTWIVASLTPAVVALATGLLAVRTTRPGISVGLLFVAAFGVIASVTPAARLPASVAIAVGGALALSTATGLSDVGFELLGDGERSLRPQSRASVVAALLATVGIGLSLSSGVGVVPTLTRPIGTVATLGGLGAAGLATRPDRWSIAAGLGAATLLLAAAIVAPFVTGATLLVAFAVASIPVPVVALGIAGAVVAVVSGIRTRDRWWIAGGLCCLAAGAPVTPERAAALVVGLVLLLGRDELPELPTATREAER